MLKWPNGYFTHNGKLKVHFLSIQKSNAENARWTVFIDPIRDAGWLGIFYIGNLVTLKISLVSYPESRDVGSIEIYFMKPTEKPSTDWLDLDRTDNPRKNTYSKSLLPRPTNRVSLKVELTEVEVTGFYCN